MKKRPSSFFTIARFIVDFFFVMAALWLTQHTSLTSIFGSFEETIKQSRGNLFIYILFGIIWIAVLGRLGAYDSEKNLRVVDEINNLILSALIANFVIAGLIYLANIPISRRVFLSFALITFFLLFLQRMTFRLLFKTKIRKSGYQRRILIAGAGEVGRRFERDIDDFSEVGYTLVGFVDDDPTQVENYVDVLGTIDQVPELIAAHQIDNLIIALPHGAYQRINTLMQTVHNLPVRVWVIPDIFALMMSKSSVWNFVGIPMITLNSPTLNKGQRVIKRSFDLAITIPLILSTLPISALIAIWIKLDSTGPVLYRAVRVKENRETFTMFKFRTMIENADKEFSSVLKEDKKGRLRHKWPDDPRVTPCGKFLRKTSLDELPQLINVLKGDMSLVGPRPELPELVAHYQPWQHMRFAVPQGLTGWWQVNGRSDKPMHLHTDEDLYYIQHYSLWLDIQILIKTLLVVLRGKGAY